GGHLPKGAALGAPRVAQHVAQLLTEQDHGPASFPLTRGERVVQCGIRGHRSHHALSNAVARGSVPPSVVAHAGSSLHRVHGGTPGRTDPPGAAELGGSYSSRAEASISSAASTVRARIRALPPLRRSSRVRVGRPRTASPSTTVPSATPRSSGPGPATPVVETASSVRYRLIAPSAIAAATCLVTAPVEESTAGSTPSTRDLASRE